MNQDDYYSPSPYKEAATIEMLKELEVRRRRMHYSPKAELGLREATGLLKKIIEFEKAGFYVPPEYGKSVFYYKEVVGEFIRTTH